MLVSALTTALAVLVVSVPVLAFLHGRKHAEDAAWADVLTAAGAPAVVLALGPLLALAVAWRQRACFAVVAEHLDLAAEEGELTGEYQKRRVAIASRRHRSGTITRRRTVVSAFFPTGLDFDLHVCRRGDGSAESEGSEPVNLGDVSFDRRLAVVASSAEKVRAFFDDARRRITLDYQAELLDKRYGLVITDRAVEITAPALADPDRLLYMLPMTVALVGELDLDGDDVTPDRPSSCSS